MRDCLLVVFPDKEGTNCFGALRCSMIHVSPVFACPSTFYLWKTTLSRISELVAFSRNPLSWQWNKKSPASKQQYALTERPTDHCMKPLYRQLKVHCLRLSLPAHSGSEDLASGHLSHPWWAARITGGVFFTTKDLDLPKSWIELKNLGNIPFYQGSSYDSPTHSHLRIRKEAPAS